VSRGGASSAIASAAIRARRMAPSYRDGATQSPVPPEPGAGERRRRSPRLPR
jgi:hypothetical protein